MFTRCASHDAEAKQVFSINAEGMAPALPTIEWYEEHNNGSCRVATGCWPRPPRAWRKEQLVTTWEGKTMIVVDIRRKVPPRDGFHDWYRK